MKISRIFFVASIKRATKTWNETLLQNKLNSDVARFAIIVQTFLATNQVIANWVSTDLWLDKITRESRRKREFRQIKSAMGLSNAQNIQIFCQKVELLTNFFATSFRNLEQPNVLKGQGAIFYLWVVKSATLLFISFSSNTAKVAHFVARFTVALAQKVYFFFSGGSSSLHMEGGGKGRRLGHPDPEIRGAVSKFFLALWASVWSKNKGRTQVSGTCPGSTTV